MLIHEKTPFVSVLRSLTPLPEDEETKVINLFQTQVLQRKEFFIRAGDIPQTIGFILSGILRLYYVDDNGNEFTKSFCTENDFVDLIVHCY